MENMQWAADRISQKCRYYLETPMGLVVRISQKCALRIALADAHSPGLHF